MQKTSGHISTLDGLRAIAILLVLGYHSSYFFWMYNTEPFFGPFGNILTNGRIGVDLFFCLSGFLITTQLMGNYFDSGYSKESLAAYFWRRFFRIAPAYYLVLTIICIGAIPNYPENPDHVWGWRYVYHLLFLQDYFPLDIYSVFWSLAIELKFYIAAPFIVRGLLAIKNRWVRYGLLLTAVGCMMLLRYATITWWHAPFDDNMTYFLDIRNRFHLSMDGLLLGMLTAFLYHDRQLRDALQKKHVANFLFIAGFLIVLAVAISHPQFYVVGIFVKVFIAATVSLGFSMIMLGLLSGSWGQRFFSTRPLAFIAKISYSAYLVHMIVIRPSIEFVYSIYPVESREMTTHYPQNMWFFLLTLIPFLGITGIISTLLYNYVEKPMIDWSRRTAKTRIKIA